MSDAPYREPAVMTGVCPRCAERDAKRSAVMAWLTRAATYFLRFCMCMLMIAHWSTATVALAIVMGSEMAFFGGVLGTVAMGVVAAGVVSRDRSVAVPLLVAWTKLISVSWAIFVWNLK